MEKSNQTATTPDSNERNHFLSDVPKAKAELKKIEGWIEKAEKYCAENPGKAIGFGLAGGTLLGFAVAKLFGRRKSTSERVITTIFDTGHDLWDRVKSNVDKPMKDLKDLKESIEGRFRN